MPGIVDTAARGAVRPKASGAAKPSLEVEINQHFTSKAYTSGSHVSGHVVVKSPRDLSYDAFNILFTGTVATRLDFVQSYTTNSVRTFLKLRMPIDNEHLPEDRVFVAGKTYSIPFHFVIPHQLIITSCNHGCENPAVKDQHLCLPPTIGYWEADDQAPDMTHIEYAIKAQAVSRSAPGSEPKYSVVEGKKIIKVLPALPEEAPLDIKMSDERYCMSKTKTLRKNLFAGKLGELKVTGRQPKAVMLSSNGLSASETTARINLEFEPTVADGVPPKINSVAGKIITTTFFGSTPQDKLPNFGPKDSYATNQLLTYDGTHNLFTTRPEKVSWAQSRIPLLRKDSGYSTVGSTNEDEMTASDEEAQSNPRVKEKKKKSPGSGVKHCAAIDLPIKIPVSNKRIFLPTFHNCLISRTYVLQLTLSVGPSNTTFSLNVPLQIGVEQRFDPRGDDELPSFESAMAQAEGAGPDDYLRPRSTLQVPNNTNIVPMPRTGSILPGYDEIRRPSVPVA
ncbi:unnamed protein product [Clonostachys rhizophaga]|uniref:Bul1 C-terminal domain-containing protein n=1 Tax=Clonostachys rhizophaga TaxID=160324 RepID=A0A9N9YKZ1_9HYPO|nr:unnamed protein product [Clonostachys rhizophaga]